MQKSLKKALYVILTLALVMVSVMGFGLTNLKNAAPAYAANDAVVTATAPPTVVNNGAEFTVKFEMNNTSGRSVFALDFVLTYNKEAFTYVSGEIDTTLFSESKDMTKLSDGSIKIAPEASSKATVSKPTYQFATAVFKVNDTATTGDHTFQISALAVSTLEDMTVTGGKIPSSAVNAKVKVVEPSTSADITSEIVVKGDGKKLDGILKDTTYTVKNSVPFSTAVTITAAVSPKASLTINGQNATSGQPTSVKLNTVGVNSISIVITAEDKKTTKTYTVKVTRAPGNTSTEIVGLAVKDADGADLSASLSEDVYTVSGTIAYADRESIKLNITTAATASLNIAGNEAVSGADTGLTLIEGENRILIIVQAETGESKDYTLVLTVEAPKTEYGLATLNVSSGGTQFELSPTFLSDVYIYVLRIPDNTETLSVTATTNDTSAEVVSGVGEYTKEQIGAGTILTITVRAQSGETKNYQLVVVHTSSVKEGLSSLTVNGSTIDLVDGKYSYDIKVDKDAVLAELDFKTLFNEDVEVLGNTQLVAGNNTIVLKVELKDGSYRHYTINISKEIKNDNTLAYVMIGVAAALFVSLVIALVLAIYKKKKNDNNPDGGIHVNVTLPETAAKEEPKEIIEPKETDKTTKEEDKEQIAVVLVKEETTTDGEVVLAQLRAETLAQAYEALSREQKSFFDNLKKYALGQSGASITTAKKHETIKIGKTPILKLQIKRGVTIASFMLENEQLKEFRMQAARNEGAQIKVKASEIAICNLETYNTAVGMVDLMVKQCDI